MADCKCASLGGGDDEAACAEACAADYVSCDLCVLRPPRALCGAAESEETQEVAGSRFLDDVGASSISARVLTLDLFTDWAAVDRSTLDSPLFFDVPVGPLQAEVRVVGVLPEYREESADEPAPEEEASACQPFVRPTGGASGPYCWIFRSARSGPTSQNDLELQAFLPGSVPGAISAMEGRLNAEAKVLGNPERSALLVTCEADAIRCLDGVDNDQDGLEDCSDADCMPYCSADESTEAGCSDGVDNDADGLVDCSDPGCAGTRCEQSQGECRDGVDNDGDNLINCADPDCAWLCSRVGCTTEPCPADRCELEGEELDCEDPPEECAWRCGVESGSDDSCTDGKDNDGDTLVDGSDPDCSSAGGGR